VHAHEGEWALRISTAEGYFEEDEAQRFAPEGKLELLPHSMALLTQAPQES
jgi:isoamylase